VADKRCDNGHFIDESWDLCPYCPQEGAEAEIPVVRPARVQGDASRVVPQASRSAVATPPPALAGNDGGPPEHVVERTTVSRKADIDGETHRYVVAWLVGLSGPTRGESFPVRMGRNVLGRDRRSDVVVNDDQASAHHADLVFRAEERRFILMDHNSTNGTYVNESEIEPRRDLITRDVIRIGSHRFLFVPLCGDTVMWGNEGDLK
jgi:hypothetical protein